MGIHSLVRVTGIQHMRQPDYTVHTFSIVWSSFGVDNLRACNENRFGDIQWGSMVLSGRAKESPFPHTPPQLRIATVFILYAHIFIRSYTAAPLRNSIYPPGRRSS